MAVDLRARALAYTRRWIPFAKYLDAQLAALPLETWEVIAVTNGDAGYRNADLDEGLGGGPKADSALDALAELAIRHLSTASAACVVVEHALALPTDPFLVDIEMPFVRSGDGIYFFATSQMPPASVRQVLRVVPDYPYVGCFSTLPPGTLRDREEIAPELIELLSRNAAAVVIGAFDGEGYLVWTPSGQLVSK